MQLRLLIDCRIPLSTERITETLNSEYMRTYHRYCFNFLKNEVLLLLKRAVVARASVTHIGAECQLHAPAAFTSVSIGERVSGLESP